jgi:hypothetical protein
VSGVGRWLLASAVFLGIGLIGVRFGHGYALALLLALLALVAAFGGKGPKAEERPAHGSGALPSDDR